MEDFTIVVPTHNRHALLDRVLPTLLDFNVPILIIDSSDTRHPTAAEHEQIDYVHCPNAELLHKLRKYITERVRTSYMMMNADDIFPIKSNVSKCLTFLKENPDYSSAQGASYYNSAGVFKKYRDDYALYQADSNCPGTRMMQHFLCGSHNFYSVMRTKHWQEILLNFPNLAHPQLSERFQILMTLILGKTKRFDNFFHLVDDGESCSWDVPTRGYHWHSKKFVADYETFRTTIADYLCSKENITLKCAYRYIDATIALQRSQYTPVIEKPKKIKWWQLKTPNDDIRYRPTKLPHEKIKREINYFFKKLLGQKQKQDRKQHEKLVAQGYELLQRTIAESGTDARAEIKAVAKLFYKIDCAS